MTLVEGVHAFMQLCSCGRGMDAGSQTLKEDCRISFSLQVKTGGLLRKENLWPSCEPAKNPSLRPNDVMVDEATRQELGRRFAPNTSLTSAVKKIKTDYGGHGPCFLRFMWVPNHPYFFRDLSGPTTRSSRSQTPCETNQ